MTASTASAATTELAERLDAGIRAGLLRSVHAVIASHGGSVILERYYRGGDENWGQPLGEVTFGPGTLHDLRSVTKSMVGLLYGIALDQGLVPPPSAPLLAQFPEYPELAADPRRAQLTVAHALTMTLGMQWDEARPYTDLENSEIAMEAAADRYRYILDRPFVTTPGTRWIYSGGAVALLGHMIARGARMTLPEFARQALLAPLEITDFEWAAGRDGVASAASGLRLRARDLLRIGDMILNRGAWNGRSVVSGAWLDASFTPAIDADDGLRYGYLWFQGDAATSALPNSRRWLAGFGNGGQRLFLMPDANVCAVVFCGAYNKPDSWVTPTRIWREIVLVNL